MRDPILPFDEIMKPRTYSNSVQTYPQEQLEHAKRYFLLCKAFQEEQIALRNAKKNIKREYKKIAVGDRIYFKNLIRRHKFVPRYVGPLRVEGLCGKVVYCYDLATGKAKKVSMDRCLSADALDIEDSRNVGKAYPSISLNGYDDEGSCLFSEDISSEDVNKSNSDTWRQKQKVKADAATLRSDLEASGLSPETSQPCSRALLRQCTRLAGQQIKSSVQNTRPPNSRYVLCHDPLVKRSSDHRSEYPARLSRKNARYNLRSR